MIKHLLAGLLLFVGIQQGQSQGISYVAQNKSISQILNQLEKQYDFRFGYSIAELKGKKATISVSNGSINDLLNQLLNGSGLVFEALGDDFIAIHKATSVFVSASIVDKENEDKLPYAVVRLKGTNLGSIADENGEVFFILENPVDAVLEFSFLGYQTIEIPLGSNQKKQDFKIALNAKATPLGSVVVKEYLNSGVVSNDMAGSFKIYPQDMEILPGLVERDPLLSAQIIAGVNSNDESATRLNVRGSSAENTFTYWNNIPIYQSGHYFGTISNFIPASVGEIDIYKNFIPIEYNGPSAGMINMKSGLKLNSKANFGASINMTHADIFANLPFKKDRGAILVSVRRSYNDLITTPTYDAFSEKLFKGNIIQDGTGGTTTSETLNTDLNFNDLNLKWIYQASDKVNLSFSAFQSKNKLIASQNNELSNTTLNQNQKAVSYGFNSALNYKINKNWISDLSLSYTDYDMSYSFLNQRTDDDDDSDDDTQSRINRVKNLQFRWSNNLIIKSNQLLRFGYQLDRFDVVNQFNALSFLEEDFEDINDSKGFGHSLYSEYIWDINNQWEFMAGLRLNQFSTLKRFEVSPQIRSNYKVSDAFTLKASYGHYNQYVRALEETEYTLSNSIEQHWIFGRR